MTFPMVVSKPFVFYTETVLLCCMKASVMAASVAEIRSTLVSLRTDQR